MHTNPSFDTVNNFPYFVFAAPFDEIDETALTLNYYYPNLGTSAALTYTWPGGAVTQHHFPQNFYRLNTSKVINTYFSTRDVDDTKIVALTCPTVNDSGSVARQPICFDDNLAISCGPNLFLDTNDLKCYSACQANMSVGPGSPTTRGICHPVCTTCDDGVTCTAPNIKTTVGGISTCFKENTGTGKVYTNTDSRSALNYSYANTPPALNIDVATLLGTVNTYYLDFWMYLDTRKQYYPRKTVTGFNTYVFYTNGARITEELTATQTYYHFEKSDGTILPALGSSIINNNPGWHKYTIKVTATDIILIVDNKFFSSTNEFKHAGTTAALTYIVFCEADTACLAGNNIYWGSAYYRNLKVWDTGKYPFITDNILTTYNIYDS